MSDSHHPIFRLREEDPRFKLDAYQFVRDALTYAQDELKMGAASDIEPDEPEEPDDMEEFEEGQTENHLTGQQLCEAIRMYAIEQYGYMAKAVLNSWGVTNTGHFGDIVYNMIRIGLMKKSDNDRREDFDEVYDFDEAFLHRFEITMPE